MCGPPFWLAITTNAPLFGDRYDSWPFHKMFAANSPPAARFAMLSNSRSRSDPIWKGRMDDDSTDPAESDGDGRPRARPRRSSWSKARGLGEHALQRQYLGIPGGEYASTFTWELYERSTNVQAPLMPTGRPWGRMSRSRRPNPPRPRKTGQSFELGSLYVTIRGGSS
jgi:hypothetical protein